MNTMVVKYLIILGFAATQITCHPVYGVSPDNPVEGVVNAVKGAIPEQVAIAGRPPSTHNGPDEQVKGEGSEVKAQKMQFPNLSASNSQGVNPIDSLLNMGYGFLGTFFDMLSSANARKDLINVARQVAENNGQFPVRVGV